jgi:hypothetical protein
MDPFTQLLIEQIINKHQNVETIDVDCEIIESKHLSDETIHIS